MKRITIIGSNSFIAQNLITYLKQSPNSYEFFLYDVTEESPNDNYTRIDFDNIDDLKRIRYDVDSILIFTGRTGGVQGFDDYSSFIQINEIYFLSILNSYIEQSNRPRIIYPGSRLIFADSSESIKETSELRPKSIYAVTKLACENYLKVYKDTFGLDFVVLRICTPYGTLIKSKGSYGTFEIFWNQALTEKKITIFGDGNQRKTYTQMIDICEAFRRLIEADHLKYDNYNLGGQSLSINDVASEIAKDSGAEIVHVSWPDIYKATDGGSVVFNSDRFDNEFEMEYHSII